jgi:hypothetical protein
MYIVREIFQLKFGHFKAANLLLKEAMEKGMMPDASFSKVYSDFTGDSYRLIFENGYTTLADFEKELTTRMPQPEWQEWYGKFKEHIVSSHREILKQMI